MLLYFEDMTSLGKIVCCRTLLATTHIPFERRRYVPLRNILYIRVLAAIPKTHIHLRTHFTRSTFVPFCQRGTHLFFVETSKKSIRKQEVFRNYSNKTLVTHTSNGTWISACRAADMRTLHEDGTYMCALGCRDDGCTWTCILYIRMCMDGTINWRASRQYPWFCFWCRTNVTSKRCTKVASIEGKASKGTRKMHYDLWWELECIIWDDYLVRRLTHHWFIVAFLMQVTHSPQL